MWRKILTWGIIVMLAVTSVPVASFASEGMDAQVGAAEDDISDADAGTETFEGTDVPQESVDVSVTEREETESKEMTGSTTWTDGGELTESQVPEEEPSAEEEDTKYDETGNVAEEPISGEKVPSEDAEWDSVSGSDATIGEEAVIGEEPVSITIGEGLSMKGTNSFGSLFADILETEIYTQEKNNGCNIFSVEMENNVAIVSFETIQYATLVVAIYDEAGNAMLATGQAEVAPGEDIAYVDIEIDEMPGYFYLRGFLIDTDCMRPLCTAYNSPNYTQEMQEFLAKTIDDFDKDRVLNLDDDKANNFAVYSEETVIVPYSADRNIVTAADEASSTYVIENIDDSISLLTTGDIFAYEYGDRNVLIVKVADIVIDGTTAVITGSETSMEEVFEYVKIDTESGMQDVAVDDSTCEEGVIYEGKVEMVDEGAPQLYAFEGEGSISYADKFSFADVKLSGNAKLSGSLNFQVTAKVKLYISMSKQYLEVKLDYKAKAVLSLSGKTEERSIPLACFTISPLPGLYIRFTPSYVVEVSAKLEISGELSGTIGFSASMQDGVKNLTTTPKFKAEAKGEIAIFVGISLKPQIIILSEKVSEAELTGKVGAEVKGTITYSTEPTVNSSSSKFHECTSCLDGDITARASVSFKVKFFNSSKLTLGLSGEISVPIGDFYYSFDYGEFDFTPCPHYQFSTTFWVKDENGAVENAKISLGGKEITLVGADGVMEKAAELVTDKNGLAAGYLPSGTYSVTVETPDNLSAKKKVVIGKYATSVSILLKKPEDNSWGDGNGGEDNTGTVVNARQVLTLSGSNSGLITEKGTLYMWGDIWGQLGDKNQLIPINILEHVISVSLGDYHSGAITENGSLYMWGRNSYGQEGNGNKEDQMVPIKVLDHVVSVSLGLYHSGAITEDGSLYMWGNNYNGEVGNGNNKDQTIPVKVLEHVKTVALGDYHSGAITEDGSLYMWGSNSCGKVGNGRYEVDQTIPVKVLDHVVSISLGHDHSGAITEDGSLYMWGNNYWFGQVGNGSDKDQDIPIKVLDHVISVSLGDYHSGAITEDGSLYMWGRNSYGQVGNGNKETQMIPIKVLDHVKSVTLGGCYSGAITEDGSLYMWGRNSYGQVGNGNYGTYGDQTIPVKVLDHVVSVSLGYEHSGAITEDGSLYMWGRNNYGQVGNGNKESQLVPVKIMDNIKLPSTRQTVTVQGATPPNLCATVLSYSGGMQEATFSNLLPNEIYNFYVMKSRNAEDALSASNLLYLTQAVSDSNGNLGISYQPTELTENADAFVVQMPQIDLSSAQVELADMADTGETQYANPTVLLNGSKLTEGKDYELRGQYSASSIGTYQLTVAGIGMYTGEVNVLYKVIVTVDKTDLRAAVIVAESLKEENYTADSYSAMMEALVAAREVEADNTMTQEAVDEATERLQLAISMLKELEKPDVTPIQISGKISCFGDRVGETRVQLLDDNGNIIGKTIVTGINAEYELSDVETGSYILQVSQVNHVTREYSLVVEDEPVELDVEIWLTGDVNGDGEIDAKDKRIIYNHITGTLLTGYEFQVGDVDSSGEIDARDKRMIYNHIAGSGLLW